MNDKQLFLFVLALVFGSTGISIIAVMMFRLVDALKDIGDAIDDSQVRRLANEFLRLERDGEERTEGSKQDPERRK